jgi:hypothetical protein
MALTTYGRRAQYRASSPFQNTAPHMESLVSKYAADYDFLNPDARHSFSAKGEVIEVLKGCGIATLQSQRGMLTIHKGTDGVHFDALRPGQFWACELSPDGSNRVTHAHQQTQPTDTAEIRQMIGSDPSEPEE